MDWHQIVERCTQIKINFDISYKYLNTYRPISHETTNKHLRILLQCLEDIRVILNVNYEELKNAHKSAPDAFYYDIRSKLKNWTTKKSININIPKSIHEKGEIQKYFPEILKTNHSNKPQTIVEFLNTALKLISDFDGKSENLRSFIDSLTLVDSIKESHESTSISLIKTKLKGTARNLINNETTIKYIISKLQNSVKGESLEVLSAKIMNIKQNNKTAIAVKLKI